MQSDVAVVGGGIVGLATAWRIQQVRPATRVLVLEKEDGLARHQTGRNSGVIHSGVYYAPGSAKALTCTAGREALLDFCRTHDVPFELTGKVILAVTTRERARLHELVRRGHANGVETRLLTPAALARIEPHARAVEALHVPGAGIVDFVGVTRQLAALVTEAGGEIHTGTKVIGIDETDRTVRISTDRGELESHVLVNCAGLFSDRVAELALRRPPSVRIVPFRGEYHRLVPDRVEVCRGLIYPVPDPRFPFLGVHLTRTLDGQVLVGPNAVLALAREGYRWGVVDTHELRELSRHPGLRALARQHWPMGLAEIRRSLSRTAVARAVSRMVPGITATDLIPAESGVRAQALTDDGKLVDDFVVDSTDRTVHVLNAPSPAATASLAIGARIADLVVDRLGP